jgi:hypothetical protein
MYISGQSFRPVADGVGVGPEGGGALLEAWHIRNAH